VPVTAYRDFLNPVVNSGETLFSKVHQDVDTCYVEVEVKRGTVTVNLREQPWWHWLHYSAYNKKIESPHSDTTQWPVYTSDEEPGKPPWTTTWKMWGYEFVFAPWTLGQGQKLYLTSSNSFHDTDFWLEVKAPSGLVEPDGTPKVCEASIAFWSYD
jgi:hypothetical protein